LRFASAAIGGAVVSAAVVAGLLAGPAAADPAMDALAAPSVRSAIAQDQFYFVMTDRYRDGNPANNEGGAPGSLGQTGYLPESISYYHGGDLAGLTGDCNASDTSDQGLARLKRLGFSAIWITPPFVQRTTQGDSAAYHGYWFLDITKPDPHLGSEADFSAFVMCAHSLGIKVFVDIVVNHTADVITYPQGNSYVSLAKKPYRKATGRAFNPWSYATGTAFPRLTARRSFAKTPVVPADMAQAKMPVVLNQPTRYHNRGDIAWGSCVGRCEMDGDFSGLDDLMTEDYTVVKTLADAYGSWITRFGIDGFRIDTAKHVDPYFFGRWLPLINQTAAAAGKPGFTSFGEIVYTDPAQLSEMMLNRQLPSVLDFPYQETVKKYVMGQASGGSLAALFDSDDYYTSAGTNAYGLTTFLGNHDMGRIGFFLRNGPTSDAGVLLQQDLLAHDLLYLTRGVPVVYYGDEVGMTGSGDGTDKQARQDMFPTKVTDWQSQDRIGSTPVGQGSSLTGSSPIADRMTQLAMLRKANPALASGAQITRFGKDGVFAASRLDAATRTEYVVAFNTSTQPATITLPTSTPNASWTGLLGSAGAASGTDARITIAVPPRGSIVLRADQALPLPGAPSVSIKTAQDSITGKYRLTADVPGIDPSSVTFVMRRKGASAWTVIGTDDARPFRVFVPPFRGGQADVAAVVKDSAGNVASSTLLPVRLVPFL
jgi:glycosidase